MMHAHMAAMHASVSDFHVACFTMPPQRCAVSGVMKFNPLLHYTMLLL